MTAQPKISRENDPSEYAEVLNRLRQEPAISMQNSAGNSRPEPTLDEAREDLARAIGDVAHSLFAKKYGPTPLMAELELELVRLKRVERSKLTQQKVVRCLNSLSLYWICPTYCATLSG